MLMVGGLLLIGLVLLGVVWVCWLVGVVVLRGMGYGLEECDWVCAYPRQTHFYKKTFPTLDNRTTINTKTNTTVRPRRHVLLFMVFSLDHYLYTCLEVPMNAKLLNRLYLELLVHIAGVQVL